MTQEPSVSASGAGKNDLGAIVARELPYILVLALALFGVAYSSLARTPITFYWIILAPLVGVICVVTGWRAAEVARSVSGSYGCRPSIGWLCLPRSNSCSSPLSVG